MPNSVRFSVEATCWCFAALSLTSANSAWAVITAQKDSVDFTYQFNGDSTPTAGGGWGNTGYAGTIVGITLNSDGNLLDLSGSTNDFMNLQSSTWNSVIDDTTGHTWEISIRLKTQAEIGPDANGFNRHLLRISDGVDGATGQLDEDGDLNLSGITDLTDATDAQHIYRFAQEPNSATTEVWIDGVHAGVTATGSHTTHQWGDFTGFVIGSEIDYLRFEVGGFAPVMAVEGDLDGDGFVGSLDLNILMNFWGQTVTMGDLPSGDPSNDGFVGADDLDIVQANWGQGTPPSSPAALAPEPTSLALLTICGLTLLTLQRRSKVGLL
ncbi:hypothetical protein OAS39_05500 [Pirellulales bacterium]|nr:hypothetical protein [Pirellulales bacterium]